MFVDVSGKKQKPGFRVLLGESGLTTLFSCVTVTHVLVKKIEKVPKVTLYAYLFKPNPPNSAK